MKKIAAKEENSAGQKMNNERGNGSFPRAAAESTLRKKYKSRSGNAEKFDAAYT